MMRHRQLTEQANRNVCNNQRSDCNCEYFCENHSTNDPNLLLKTFLIAMGLFVFMFAGWWLVITYTKQFLLFNAVLFGTYVVIWGIRRTWKIVTNK